MIYLAVLSIDDADAVKVVIALGLAIVHLYWETHRCRKGRETIKDRLASLERTIAGCPIDNCPNQRPPGRTATSSGGQPVVGFCLRRQFKPNLK